MKKALYLFELVALFQTSLLAQTSAVPIEHGTITVPTGAARSLSSVTSPGVSLGGEINYGDYAVDVDPEGTNNDGVMIATIAANNPYGRYPTVSVFPDGPLERNWIGVYYPATNSSGVNEWDSNVAFAFFSDEDFDWAIAGTGDLNDNGEVITAANLRASSSVAYGTNFIDNANGTYTFDLTPTDSAKSSQNGILLTNGSKNESNFTLAKAETNGSFTIYNHDNGVNADSYERDAVRCVYIPENHGREDIAAMGRIDGNGNPIVTDDSGYTVTKSASTGIWYLSIPGHSRDTGTLVLTPEGGEGGNVDNLWSYNWNNTANHWEIHSRDINGTGDPAPTGFQNIGSEAAFSFVFITYEPARLYVDEAAPGNGSGINWYHAYTNLQDALTINLQNVEIYVAEGSYYPDDGVSVTADDREATFTLRSNVKLYGGYSNRGSVRNPSLYPTILSGDIDQNDTSGGDNSANSFHVLTAGPEVTTGAEIDGFIIERGSANELRNNTGAGAYLDSAAIDFTACIFRANTATSSGGAIRHFNVTNSTFTNCVFQGNSAQFGAAVAHAVSTPVYTNCTFQGNFAQSSGGAIYNASSSPIFRNTIIWNNRAGGSTSTLSASISGVNGSAPTYSYSLLENYNAPGIGNLNGTLPGNDPKFTFAEDPLNAPSTTSDLSLGAPSPVVGAGDNGLIASTTEIDLATNPRISSFTVDLGAYESFYFDLPPLPDVETPFSSGTESAIAGWGPDTTAYDTQFGRQLDFTLVSFIGDMVFDNPPSADPDGTLRFTLAARSRGIATFEVVTSDPDGVYPDSVPRTITISSGTIHYVDENAAGPTHDGSSWANAFIHLQDAFDVAVSDDAIWVAEGTYRPDEGSTPTLGDRTATFEMTNGVELYGGFPTGGGDQTIAARDFRNHLSILTGDLLADDASGGTNSENSHHVLTTTGANSFTRLDGFTVTAGHADGSNASDTSGAGMLCTNGSPKILNCSFVGNTASGGGGIRLTNSSPIITNSSFFGNSGSNGGGLSITGLASLPALINCVFQGNEGRTGGAAVYNSSSSPLFLNCTFQGNTADSATGGGAMRNVGAFPSLRNCLIWNNAYRGFDSDDPESSIRNETSAPSYSNCLVQHWDLTLSGNGNFDGTDPINNPLFVSEIDPVSAPNSIGSDLRLGTVSPIVGSGNNAFVPVTITEDFEGNPRILSFNVDLGAHESYFLDLPSATDITAHFSTATAFTIPDWAPDATGIINGTGPLYHFTQTAATGDIALAGLPTVVSERDLDFDTLAGTGGSLTFEVTISDPSGLFINSSYPRSFTISSGGTRLVDANVSGGASDGSSWANAYPNLQAAMSAASFGDEIWIAAGTYTGSLTLENGIALYGGFPAGGAGGDNFAARDSSIYETVLSGGGSVRVLSGNGISSNTTLDGFTIRDGATSGTDASHSNKGGGMLLTGDSSPILSNLRFIDNTATGQSGASAMGGGLALIDSGATLSSCLFEGNQAHGANKPAGEACGGAIHASGGTLPLVIGESAFSANSTQAGNGSNGTNGVNGANGGNGDDAGFNFGAEPGEAGENATTSTGGQDGGTSKGAAIHANDLPLLTLTHSSFENNQATGGSGGVGGRGGSGGSGGQGGDGADSSSAERAQPGGEGGAGTNGSMGGGGGTAKGGAIALESLLQAEISNCTFLENTATAGAAGSGGIGGDGGYGGLGGDSTLAAEDGGSGGNAGNAGDGGNGGTRGNAHGGALYLDDSNSQLTSLELLGNRTKVGTPAPGADGGDGGNGGNGRSGFTDVFDIGNGGHGGAGGYPGEAGNSSSGGTASGGAIWSADSTVDTLNLLLAANIVDEPSSIYIHLASGGNGGLGGLGGSGGSNGIFHGSDGSNGLSRDSLDQGTYGSAPTTQGGGLRAVRSPLHLANSTFAANQRVDTASFGSGADLSLDTDENSLVLIENSIFSDNTEEPANTSDQLASIDPGIDPLSQNNLIDDNSTLTDPSFIEAPSISNYGNLRLQRSSPAINSGTNDANAEALDLDGNERIQGNIIDLGAYESDFATFAAEHQLLDPDSDDNNNGLTNYTDYALGADPTAPNDPNLQPALTGNQLTFSFRNNAVDAFPVFQKSDTLQSDDWDEMILGIDYTLNTEAINGSTTTQTLELLTTDLKLFFRELFSGTE